MITNVAGLASFKGRVAELQEILRKVANETISYEDFIKWHDLRLFTTNNQPQMSVTMLNGIKFQHETGSCESIY